MNHNTSMKTSSHGKKKRKKRTSSGIASSSSTTIASSDNTNHKDHQCNDDNDKKVVTIQVIPSNDNHEHEHPIVCSFPGGIPSSCNTGRNIPREQQQLTFQWYKKSKSTMNRKNIINGSDEYVIKGQDTACQYYGNCVINNNNNNNNNNTSASNNKSSLSYTKLCVAIYDKHTNQVIVTPTIGNGTIISLQQFVPSYYNNKKEIDDDDNATATRTTTNALLFADFGSAKKRRVLQSQEANRVTVDAVVAIGTSNKNNNNNNTNNNANDMIFHNSKMSESNRMAIQQQQQMNMAIEATTTPNGSSNNIDDNDDDDVEQGQGTTNSNNINTNSTNSSMNLAIEIATNSWRQTFLPNYNFNAKNAKDIYNISLIVGYDIWNHTLHNIIKKYNILNDTNNGTSLINYFNRNNISNSSNESHPYHSNHKDIIYCTELVQKLIETKIKYNTQNHNHNQQNQQQLELYKCILLLNYFICLYKQFQSNKFKLPMISTSLSDDHTNDYDDNDDIDKDNNDNNEMNDDNGDNTNTNNGKRNSLSLRTKLYGTTPISIIQRFLDLFTTSTNFDHSNTNTNTSNMKHIMSRAQQDKCLVHIFIIYIMTYANGMNSNNNNSKNNNTDKGIVISDIVPLFYELQLNDNINHGILLLRQAGCIVTRTNTPSGSKDTNNNNKQQKKIKVELNVPLTFPKTKKKQR